MDTSNLLKNIQKKIINVQMELELHCTGLKTKPLATIA